MFYGMKKQVEPPRPVTLLAFFSFIFLAGGMFVVMPILFGVASLGVASFEIAGSDSVVSGDFNAIVFGTVLWKVASWPFRHWIASSSVVVVGTLLFVLVTSAVNRK